MEHIDHPTDPFDTAADATFATVCPLDPSIDPATVPAPLTCGQCGGPIPHGATFAILKSGNSVAFECLRCADAEGA